MFNVDVTNVFNVDQALGFFPGFSIEYFLSELSNYLLLVLFLIIFVRIKLIPKEYFLIWMIFLISPFFFNYLLFDPGYMGDQFRYMGVLNFVHQGAEIPDKFLDKFGFSTISTVYFVASLWSYVPIFSTMTLISGAFINKFLLLIFYCYLYRIADKKLITLTLIIPSFLLYSSVSLREIPIIIFATLALIFMYKKKVILMLLSLLFLFFVKLQNVPGLLVIALGYFLNLQKSYFRITLYSILLIAISFLFYDFYIPYLDLYKLAFFVEDGGGEIDYTFNINDGYFAFLSDLIPSFFNFLFRPFPFEAGGLLGVAVFLEVMTLYGVFAFFIYKLDHFNIDIKIFLIFALGLLATILLYSFIASNFGTFSRYRFSIYYPFIIFFIFLISENKSKRI